MASWTPRSIEAAWLVFVGVIVAAAWGTVYGIARLGALGQIPRSVPGDIDSLLHEALDSLRLGWQASGSVGPHG